MTAQAGVAVLTVSDTRTAADDPSGDLLREALKAEGHRLAGSAIVADDIRRIRNRLWRWIADPQIDAVITTGGTEVGRDGTIEVVRALLDVERSSFAERFEVLPHPEGGAPAMRWDAIAGAAGGTAIFALPGLEPAVRIAWTNLLREDLAHAVAELRR